GRQDHLRPAGLLHRQHSVASGGTAGGPVRRLGDVPPGHGERAVTVASHVQPVVRDRSLHYPGGGGGGVYLQPVVSLKGAALLPPLTLLYAPFRSFYTVLQP